MSAPNELSIDQPSHVVRIQRNSLPNMTSTEKIGYELHSSSFKSTKNTPPVYHKTYDNKSPKILTTAVSYNMYNSESPRSSTTAASLKRRPSITPSGGSLFYSHVVTQQIVACKFKDPYRHVPPKDTSATYSHACIAGIFAIIVVSSAIILTVTELTSTKH